jgi:hypothetical protein
MRTNRPDYDLKKVKRNPSMTSTTVCHFVDLKLDSKAETPIGLQ